MGLDKDSMSTILTRMETEQKMAWKRQDSLLYFYALATSERLDEAFLILDRLRHFTPTNADELHLIQYAFAYKRNTKQFLKWLNYEKEHFGQSDTYIYLRKRIHAVDLMIAENQWSFQDSVVFPELLSTSVSGEPWKKMSKGSKVYQEQLIPYVMELENALRIETKYEFKSNYALAEALLEFAIFLKKYVSTTDAFIVIAVAKYYDKFNNEINQKYRDFRVAMNQKRLIFPSMREYFTKFEKGYFNINSIKKRQLEVEKPVLVRERNPEALRLKEVESNELVSDTQMVWIVMSSLLLLLLYVLFFVKAKN